MAYAKLKNGIVTTKEDIPNTPKKTFWMTVDGRGYIHLFWCGGYTNNVGGKWKKPVNVDLGPYEGKKRKCLTYQIARSLDNESVYASSWGYKIQALFKITKLDADKPVVTMHQKWGGRDRFPIILGPDHTNPGDGNGYIGIGAPQYVLHKIDASGKVSQVTNNLTRVALKTGEGQSLFWVENDVAIITHANGEQRILLNTKNRSAKKKQGLEIVGPNKTNQRMAPLGATTPLMVWHMFL